MSHGPPLSSLIFPTLTENPPSPCAHSNSRSRYAVISLDSCDSGAPLYIEDPPGHWTGGTMAFSSQLKTSDAPLLPGPTTHLDGIPAEDLQQTFHTSLNDQVDPSAKLQVIPDAFYAPYISEQSKGRLPNPIREVISIAERPGMLPLFAGLPASETFPFTSLSMTVRSPTDPDKETALTIDGTDLKGALQYSAPRGMPGLMGWLEGLQARVHNRKAHEGWRISIGAGSQDLLYKAILGVLNPGDSVLIEAPVYAAVIPILKSLDCDITEIESDENGISSDCLQTVLDNWPPDKAKPKVLYTVPYGCNPTGMSASTERRRHVLRLARKHGILIFEDDPYYYTYYGVAARPPSYFRLEAEETEHPIGMVVRFDSFSKILSAGLRIGFVSGPHVIIDAIDIHTASSNLQPSSLSQVVAFTLLRHWGYDGFQAHTDFVARTYRSRRDVFATAMKKYLSGLAEWRSPEAGMFFWFKLTLPPSSDGSEVDSEDITLRRGVEKGVLALPGTSFFALGRRTAYVRASFSILNGEQTDEAVRRLAEAVKEVWAQATQSHNDIRARP